MGLYRAHFVNHADHIFGVSHFDAEHDEAAIAHARQVFRSGIGKGYEIWHEDRLVHKQTHR
jgi:glyoxylase-like metal-dependent hydrolase (beta-lactamase superfamily II)